MVDYIELLRILSVPRPNGSAAERETARALGDWLTRRGIVYRCQQFKLYPYFNEGIGLWIIASRTLLVLAVALRWGWLTLPIAGLTLLGGLLDVLLRIPFTTWPGACRSENILLEFEPPGQAGQEIILAAHYDSKTELLDHTGAAFFVRKLHFGIILTVLLGLMGPLERVLSGPSPLLAAVVYWLGLALGGVMLFLAWGYGLHMSLGRWMTPSQGAIDNGAACTILLDLADRLGRGEIWLDHTRVTIALFGGEEVGMQGSRAYVQSRAWSLPAIALNLEIMGQDGEYVIWQREGNGLQQLPTTPGLNQAIAGVVAEVTGRPPRFVGSLVSDSFSFLAAGIPTTVLGTYHSQMGGGGLHRPTDSLDRVVLPRLAESVEIVARLLQKHDSGEMEIESLRQ
jgi:hypothetical protein